MVETRFPKALQPFSLSDYGEHGVLATSQRQDSHREPDHQPPLKEKTLHASSVPISPPKGTDWLRHTHHTLTVAPYPPGQPGNLEPS